MGILANDQLNKVKWEGFEGAIMKRFSTTMNKSNAQASILTIKQGNKPIDEFLDEFERLLNISKLGAEAGKVLLWKALSPKIGQAISASGELPHEWEEFLSKARAIR